jgi:hypothetical protein
MQMERILILVDRSRDAVWSDALIDIEPDDVYQATDNRDYLKWSVLKNYDVLTICGYPILEYKDEEIQIIKKFVELGGGLLLASSTGRFVRDVDKPISEMQLNKIANIFGAEFLPLSACKAELEADHNQIRGYNKKNLYLGDRPVFADLYLDDIPFSNCGIVLISGEAEAVIYHNQTLEPVCACTSFGKGRVLIMNEVTFSQRSQRTCRAFMDWLGCNRFSKVSDDERITDEIFVDEYVREDGNIKIHYNSFVTADRVDKCLSYAKKIQDFMVSTFTDNTNKKWKIELVPSCTYERTSMWREPIKGAYMSDSMLAYAVGVDGIMRNEFLRNLARNVFDDTQAFSEYCGIIAMRILGFENDADRLYFEIIRNFRDIDPSGTEFDITKAYHYHPKIVWILTTLTDKYGYDLFARLQKIIQSYYLEQAYSPLDVFIYRLSLALGEDMYSWFRKIGTTVHELPLYKEDTDEFRNGICQYLKNVVRDKSAKASDRYDAIQGLICVKETYNLALDDKYDLIVSGIDLYQSCDNRALSILKEFADDKDDPAISAIAYLARLQLGDSLVAEKLADISISLDYRFQLNISHALKKIGDDNDTKPVTEIEYDGADLKVYVTIEGHRVAHVFSSVDCNAYHFPDNTHITGAFIDWVSTQPEYRRIGLSRFAIEETFAHPSMKRCSCAFLTTGVENPAHALYRSFGFVDQDFMEAFNFDIREEKVNVPEDIILRSYSPGDEVKMAEFANKCYSNSINVKRIKAIKKSDDIIKIAERNGEMLGYVLASTEFNRDITNLKEICLQKTDEQFNIGSLLLRSLHNELFSHGYRSLTFWGKYRNRENLRELLNTLGYYSNPVDGVRMFKIINLPMLLDEIIPLLTKRLMNSDYKDWQGKIGISGNQHKATIIIENEICIAEDVYKDVNIHVISNDDTITRIVIGRLTPYEAYLQRELAIKPIVSDRVMGLLKTLFPKIPD